MAYVVEVTLAVRFALPAVHDGRHLVVRMDVCHYTAPYSLYITDSTPEVGDTADPLATFFGILAVLYRLGDVTPRPPEALIEACAECIRVSSY